MLSSTSTSTSRSGRKCHLTVRVRGSSAGSRRHASADETTRDPLAPIWHYPVFDRNAEQRRRLGDLTGQGGGAALQLAAELIRLRRGEARAGAFPRLQILDEGDQAVEFTSIWARPAQDRSRSTSGLNVS